LVVDFHATAPPKTYTLSLHDALPISLRARGIGQAAVQYILDGGVAPRQGVADQHQIRRRLQLGGIIAFNQADTGLRQLGAHGWRSEEHTSELQSRENLVCRLLLEKKK